MPEDTNPKYYLYGGGKKVHIYNPLNVHDTFCGLGIYAAKPLPKDSPLDLGESPFDPGYPTKGVAICANCWWAARDARHRVRDHYAAVEKQSALSKYVTRVRDLDASDQESLLVGVLAILDDATSMTNFEVVDKLDELFKDHRTGDAVLTVELHLKDLRPGVLAKDPDDLKDDVEDMVSRALGFACWWDGDPDYDVLTTTLVEE